LSELFQVEGSVQRNVNKDERVTQYEESFDKIMLVPKNLISEAIGELLE
jgi:hypothetical protein